MQHAVVRGYLCHCQQCHCQPIQQSSHAAPQVLTKKRGPDCNTHCRSITSTWISDAHALRPLQRRSRTSCTPINYDYVRADSRQNWRRGARDAGAAHAAADPPLSSAPEMAAVCTGALEALTSHRFAAAPSKAAGTPNEMGRLLTCTSCLHATVTTGRVCASARDCSNLDAASNSLG